MQICPECERVMVRSTSTGTVVYLCYCGTEVKGTPADARIAGGILHAGETEEMYKRLIQNAPHDRVNKQVYRDCPKCGLDYMAQIRVGTREVVVWACKCGYRAGPGDEDDSATEKAPATRSRKT